MRPRNLSKDQEAQLISMRLKGSTYREIGDHFNIPLNTAGEYCRRRLGPDPDFYGISDEEVMKLLKEWRGDD